MRRIFTFRDWAKYAIRSKYSPRRKIRERTRSSGIPAVRLGFGTSAAGLSRGGIARAQRPMRNPPPIGGGVGEMRGPGQQIASTKTPQAPSNAKPRRIYMRPI